MSTDQMEQAFLDGTHPALRRDADAMATLRSNSPPPSSHPTSLAHSRSASRSSHSSLDHDHDHDGEERGGFSAVDPDPPTGGTMPPRRPGGGRGGGQSRNTGVKGVQNDYREHLAAQAQGQGQAPAQVGRKKTVVSLASAQDEEDAELERLREKRLRDLQGSGQRPQGAEDVVQGARTFGHLREVGFEGFLSAIEDEDAETAVVVHLYEPEIPPCYLLNQHLSHLARSYPSTKFLRAQASEVDFMSTSTGAGSVEVDVDTLPTVLVYRGGDIETIWVRFDLEVASGELGEGEQTRREVEEVLASKSAISSVPSTLSSGFTSANGAIRTATPRNLMDEDDD
ncbi:hypothetical protein JCM10207_001725 [Rhodosporidiobolus poonsookiae]